MGLADLGVIASVQPAFVPSDARWLDERLGPTRGRWAYPFRSMLDAGVELVYLGQDGVRTRLGHAARPGTSEGTFR